MNTTNVNKALYIGSFDPITLGHMDIIRRASAMSEFLTVAIGNNPNKKYMFEFRERAGLVQDAVKLLNLSNVFVQTNPVEYLTADYARIYGYNIIVKGARTAQDFDYEKLIHEISVTQQREIETVLLFSSTHLSHVSSSAAKELARFQGLVHEYVPIHVKAAMEAKLGQYIIGVTGTIGSGKSSFCQMVSGTTHINMDPLSHELLVDSQLPLAVQTREKIMNRFGTCDRKKLGEAVFGNPEELAALNAILKEPMLTRLREKMAGKKGIIFLEGALLAEMNWLFLCNNRVILVKTPDPEEHTRRLRARGHSDEQIARRIASQYDYDEKIAVIAKQMNKDQFGKCLIFDSQNPDWHDATGEIQQFIQGLSRAKIEPKMP